MDYPRNGDIVVYVAEPPVSRWVTTRHADIYYEFRPSSGAIMPSTIGMGITGVRDWEFMGEASPRRQAIVLRPNLGQEIDGDLVVLEAMAWRGTPYNFGQLARLLFRTVFPLQDKQYQYLIEDAFGVTETPSPMVCSEFAAMLWRSQGLYIYDRNMPRNLVMPDHILAFEGNDIIAVYDYDGNSIDLVFGEQWRIQAQYLLGQYQDAGYY